ncbi:MAG: FMN reductase (NADPH) [Planctomycetota bacterium]|jgi:FMN reductase (NADPH)
MNDVMTLMAAHRSVRSFAPAPVTDSKIRAAVASAQCAATSSWIQAYSLIQVIEGGERERIAELCGNQAQVQEAGAFFVLCGDQRRHKLLAERAGSPRSDNLETSLLAITDACLFAQNLTLAFESMGLGCCYIGGLRTRLQEVDRLLELPQGVLPLFGICVGEPLDRSATRPRLSPEAVWMKGRYANDESVIREVEEHDEAAAEHYAERGLEGRNWSGGMHRKFAQPLRPHLAEYYQSKGARFD